MNIDLSTPISNQAFFAGYSFRQKEGGWVLNALKGLGGIGKVIVTYALLGRGVNALSRDAITQSLLGRSRLSSALKNKRKTPPRRPPPSGSS
jgi:hypothetical protein